MKYFYFQLQLHDHKMILYHNTSKLQ